MWVGRSQEFNKLVSYERCHSPVSCVTKAAQMSARREALEGLEQTMCWSDREFYWPPLERCTICTRYMHQPATTFKSVNGFNVLLNGVYIRTVYIHHSAKTLSGFNVVAARHIDLLHKLWFATTYIHILVFGRLSIRKSTHVNKQSVAKMIFSIFVVNNK